MIMLLHYYIYQYVVARLVTEKRNTVLSGCYLVCMTQYFKVTGPTEDEKRTKLEVLSYVARLQNFPSFS